MKSIFTTLIIVLSLSMTSKVIAFGGVNNHWVGDCDSLGTELGAYVQKIGEKSVYDGYIKFMNWCRKNEVTCYERKEAAKSEPSGDMAAKFGGCMGSCLDQYFDTIGYWNKTHYAGCQNTCIAQFGTKACYDDCMLLFKDSEYPVQEVISHCGVSCNYESNVNQVSTRPLDALISVTFRKDGSWEANCTD